MDGRCLAALRKNAQNNSKLQRVFIRMDSDQKAKEQPLEDVLKELFDGDEQLISRWLETPVPALAGASPKTLMETPTGCEVLESHIEKLKYGDYS